MPYKDPERRREVKRNYARKNRATISRNSRITNRNRKAYLVALAGGKCIKCGYSKSLRVLQFHHINPDEKDSNVSQLRTEKAVEEIKKCILLCANCHIELHEELQLEAEDGMVADLSNNID